MRTKTLLLTAAIGAAGIATSMAQVYSQNAVGYINITIQTGFNLLANQLIQPTQTLDALMPTPPDSTSVYKFISGPGGGFQIKQYDAGLALWLPDGLLTVGSGEGFFVGNVSGGPFTLTLVGEVPQGTLSVPLVNGLNMISSKVPQSGLLSTDLGFPAEEADQSYQFVNDGINPAGYNINQYDSGLGLWLPAEPSLKVGEGFWIRSDGTHANWTRTFSVN